MAAGASLVLAITAHAQEGEPGGNDLSSARAKVDRSAQEVIRLRGSGVAKEEKDRKIDLIARENFDFELMAKLVLRKSWNDLDEQQRREFVDEFTTMLIRRYRWRLIRSDVEKIEVDDPIPLSATDVEVATTLIGGVENGRSISYRMRRLDESEWKVIDVEVEGVSILQSYRSQFVEILDQPNGTDKLLERVANVNRDNAPASVSAPPP